MKAITYSHFGPASDTLSLQHVDIPTPGPGDVLVKLATSAVNPSDVRARAGGRPGVTKPPFPMIIPHSDGAGVIVEVGDGVPQHRVNEAVWIWNGQWQRPFGTAAEYICISAEHAVPLEDGVSFQQGAVLGIPGLTATHALFSTPDISGKRILISGGAGSVGYLAVQMAAHNGAEVFTTAHPHDADALKQAGAHHIFDYSSPSLADDILAASSGQLMDKAIEVEFGNNIQTLAEVIAPSGRIVSYGSAQDMTPTLPFYPLMFKAVSIDLILIYLLNRTERQTAISKLTSELLKGYLDIRISAELPLAHCSKAHEMVEKGNRKGAVLLSLDPSMHRH